MSGVLMLVNSKPYRSSTHLVQPASMLFGGSNSAMRGFLIASPGRRDALAANRQRRVRARSSATSFMPLIT